MCVSYSLYLDPLLTYAATSLQERAFEASQKYKEGKYILERNLLTDVQ